MIFVLVTFFQVLLIFMLTGMLTGMTTKYSIQTMLICSGYTCTKLGDFQALISSLHSCVGYSLQSLFMIEVWHPNILYAQSKYWSRGSKLLFNEKTTHVTGSIRGSFKKFYLLLHNIVNIKSRHLKLFVIVAVSLSSKVMANTNVHFFLSWLNGN